jgi:hypothetical protein
VWTPTNICVVLTAYPIAWTRPANCPQYITAPIMSVDFIAGRPLTLTRATFVTLAVSHIGTGTPNSCDTSYDSGLSSNTIYSTFL